MCVIILWQEVELAFCLVVKALHSSVVSRFLLVEAPAAHVGDMDEFPSLDLA